MAEEGGGGCIEKKKKDKEVKRGRKLQAQTLQTPHSICTQY